MIRKILFLLPIVASIFATSCKDDEPAQLFSISPQNITFKSEGDSTSLTVYGEGENWKMWIGKQGDDERWCSFNKAFTEFEKSGKGRTEGIKVFSKPNPNRFKLNDTLYIEDLTGRFGIIKVKLTLAAIGIIFETENKDSVFYIPSQANDYKLRLKSNVDNRNFACPSNVTAVYNEADTSVTFSFAANNEVKPLVTNIVATGNWTGEKVKSVTLDLQFIQDGTTSRTTDSTTLVALNNQYGLGWDLTAPMSKWQGVLVNLIESSEGIVNRVTALDLQNKNITATLPTELSNLVYLQSLRLNKNNFSGTIPESYYNLPYLELLWLGNNPLTGTLNNDKIVGWESMQNLSIIKTQINGEIPANLSLLKKLKSLELNDNELTGNLPTELGKSKILKTFIVSNNYLTLTPIPDTYTNNINWFDWNPEKNIIPQR